jgi:hypothetical protein
LQGRVRQLHRLSRAARRPPSSSVVPCHFRVTGQKSRKLGSAVAQHAVDKRPCSSVPVTLQLCASADAGAGRGSGPWGHARNASRLERRISGGCWPPRQRPAWHPAPLSGGPATGGRVGATSACSSGQATGGRRTQAQWPAGVGGPSVERGRRSESGRELSLKWWARRPTVGARVAQRAGPAPGKGTMARAHCRPVCPVWAPLMFQRFHREGTQ